MRTRRPSPSPLVEVVWPRGHAYRVTLRFLQRSLRKAGNLVCPECLTSFKPEKVYREVEAR